MKFLLDKLKSIDQKRAMVEKGAERSRMAVAKRPRIGPSLGGPSTAARAPVPQPREAPVPPPKEVSAVVDEEVTKVPLLSPLAPTLALTLL